MRYNAFFGELPLNAFKPRPSGGMTLEGGGNPISAVTDAVDNVVSGVGDIGQSAIDATADAGRWIDQTVRQEIPGGWTGAALIAAGAYYAPEIGAWLDSSGAIVPGSEGVAPEVGTSTSGFTGELPAGYTGYTPPQVTTLGTVAGPTEGMGSLSGLGENAYTAAQDATDLAGVSNAGGAGLTGVPATVASLMYPAANAAAGAGAGSSLASMLPYMTAAQVGTGILQANAAKQGANTQAAAADRASQVVQQNLNTINQQQAPQRALGYTGGVTPLGELGSGTYQIYDANGNPTGTGQGSGYLTHQFNAADLAAGLAPNYDFMLQQGQMANQRAANATGGGFGGNALQGLNKFTQDYAGNAYQNAFTNYQNQRNNIYNTLAGIAGIGQTGQNQANTAATNTANAMASLGVGSAGAQAAGQVGQTNALANTANNIIGNYTLASLLNQRGSVA